MYAYTSFACTQLCTHFVCRELGCRPDNLRDLKSEVKLTCCEDQTRSLPIDKILDQENKIHFFTQLDLLSDELADCGTTEATIKLVSILSLCASAYTHTTHTLQRVMKDFWYLNFTQHTQIISKISRKVCASTHIHAHTLTCCMHTLWHLHVHTLPLHAHTLKLHAHTLELHAHT